MKFWHKAALFTLGGWAYCALEMVWRGRTHGSMFLAGGASFLLIGQLNHVKPKLFLPLRAYHFLLCGGNLAVPLS